MVAKKERSSWAAEEDQRLEELVGLYGTKSWSFIAQAMSGRVGKQCRERWRNHLDPSIRRDDFTKEEDALVLRLVKLLGTRWARISEKMPGRTENAVKNRYYCFLRGPGDSPPNSKRKQPAKTRARKSRRSVAATPPSEENSWADMVNDERAELPERMFLYPSKVSPVREPLKPRILSEQQQPPPAAFEREMIEAAFVLCGLRS